MNTLWIKIIRLIVSLKEAFFEELWMLGLLLPVVAIAIFTVLHFDRHIGSEAKADTIVKAVTKVNMASKTIAHDLSEAEVAIMVEMPLNQLLNVQAYFDDQNNVSQQEKIVATATPSIPKDGAELPTLSTENVGHNNESNLMLAYQPRRNRSKDQKLSGETI